MSTRAARRPPKTFAFDFALFDSLLLSALLVLMCSQLNLGDIGRDTTAQGYVTKQLKVALPDIALFLAFVWFALRTTMLRAWRKIWWPPFPCWALFFVMLLAIFHSRPLISALALNIQEAHGIKEILKALLTKESKEAIAETIQFVGYFLIAPLLFVNLIHDRRLGVLLSRRRLALTTFLWALVAVLILAVAQKSDLGFQGPFGSPNALSAFLAVAGALLAARLGSAPHAKWRGTGGITAVALAVSLALVSSVWAGLALLLGVAVGCLAQCTPRRALAITGAAVVVAAAAWCWLPSPKLRTDSLHLASQKELVKKQYVEWFVASTRLADSRESSFATGVGPGNYQFNIGSYYARLPNEEKMPPDSNNLYLVQAVNLGVLGLGVLLWVVSHFGNIAFVARRKHPDDWLAAGVLGALAAWLFVNLFHAAIVRGTGVVFAFILSLAVIALERSWEKPEASNDQAPRNFLDSALS
jgi:hypothetical protein